MNPRIATSEELSVEPITSRSVPATPTTPLREVLDAVRTDCQDAPEQYLDETKVPHGGE